MVFDANEEHKGISSSFSSEIKRIDSNTSNSTIIMRDRGVSGVSQASIDTSTQIIRVVDDNQSSTTLNSLMDVSNKNLDPRMKTQQVRKTASEL